MNEPEQEEIVVVDEPEHHRYVVVQEGVTAELVYRQHGNRIVIVHTGVPDALGGRGIASALVQAVVARAREQSLTVVPQCPYAREWLHEHPDAAGTVDIDWPAPAG